MPSKSCIYIITLNPKPLVCNKGKTDLSHIGHGTLNEQVQTNISPDNLSEELLMIFRVAQICRLIHMRDIIHNCYQHSLLDWQEIDEPLKKPKKPATFVHFPNQQCVYK
jgi:hypothetical protein